jgi:hypothetical protein
MIPHYKKAGNIALGFTVICVAAIGILGSNSTNGNVWGPGGAPSILMYGTALSILAMFWSYAKAKGQSGWFGVLLPLLNIIGLFILLKLQDRHPTESASHDVVQTSSAKAWATYLFVAAGLAALAYVFFIIKSTGA